MSDDLTIAEASEELGVSPQHVRRLRAARKLDYGEPVRGHLSVSRESVERFKRQRAEAEEQAAAFSRELDDLGARLE